MTFLDIFRSKSATPAAAFDASRLHASIVRACYSVRLGEGSAEDAARHTCQGVDRWLKTHPEVTHDDIRRKAASLLGIMCPEAGYIYQHENTIL